jgi:hypothetical protein
MRAKVSTWLVVAGAVALQGAQAAQ